MIRVAGTTINIIPMDKADTIVVGAGVVGLAVARRLAEVDAEVVVLETADAIGTGTSSRNSEVIHAGIYYAAGSLKARCCVAGRKALYAYCDARGVSYKRTGKLIVAAGEAELPDLDNVAERARANGVDDLERLDADQVRELEPALSCSGALLSPSTGIVDSHGLMLALQGDAENAGAVVAFESPVVGGRVGNDEIVLRVGGGAPTEIACERLVNAAGLQAQTVAGLIEGFPRHTVPPLYFAKGNYFTLAGGHPFTHLIYPLPEPGGLGIHLGLDLGGQAKFGPDVEWVDALDYEVSVERAPSFYQSIRRYWPELADGTLQPGYVGVRPKLVPAGEPPADFAVHGPETHGVAGLVNLFGIESPGLTSSLALADEVAARLGVC